MTYVPCAIAQTQCVNICYNIIVRVLYTASHITGNSCCKAGPLCCWLRAKPMASALLSMEGLHDWGPQINSILQKRLVEGQATSLLTSLKLLIQMWILRTSGISYTNWVATRWKNLAAPIYTTITVDPAGSKIALRFLYLFVCLCICTYHMCNNYVLYIVAMRLYFEGCFELM